MGMGCYRGHAGEICQYQQRKQERQQCDRLKAEGMDKASSKKATASISYVTTADVTDWDKFWAFIHKNKFDHLLQRRVSDPAYRELLELAQSDKKLAKQLDAAGVQPFVKTNLNLRAI